MKEEKEGNESEVMGANKGESGLQGKMKESKAEDWSLRERLLMRQLATAYKSCDGDLFCRLLDTALDTWEGMHPKRLNLLTDAVREMVDNEEVLLDDMILGKKITQLSTTTNKTNRQRRQAQGQGQEQAPCAENTFQQSNRCPSGSKNKNHHQSFHKCSKDMPGLKEAQTSNVHDGYSHKWCRAEKRNQQGSREAITILSLARESGERKEEGKRKRKKKRKKKRKGGNGLDDKVKEGLETEDNETQTKVVKSGGAEGEHGAEQNDNIEQREIAKVGTNDKEIASKEPKMTKGKEKEASDKTEKGKEKDTHDSAFSFLSSLSSIALHPQREPKNNTEQAWKCDRCTFERNAFTCGACQVCGEKKLSWETVRVRRLSRGGDKREREREREQQGERERKEIETERNRGNRERNRTLKKRESKRRREREKSTARRQTGHRDREEEISLFSLVRLIYPRNSKRFKEGRFDRQKSISFFRSRYLEALSRARNGKRKEEERGNVVGERDVRIQGDNEARKGRNQHKRRRRKRRQRRGSGLGVKTLEEKGRERNSTRETFKPRTRTRNERSKQ